MWVTRQYFSSLTSVARKSRLSASTLVHPARASIASRVPYRLRSRSNAKIYHIETKHEKSIARPKLGTARDEPRAVYCTLP
jgi:hypothetical protein